MGSVIRKDLRWTDQLPNILAKATSEVEKLLTMIDALKDLVIER